MEGIYDIVLILLIMEGFGRWGLVGTGMALTVAHIVDLLVALAYTRVRYGYVPSAPVCRYALMQLPLGLASYAVTFVGPVWLRIVLAGLIVAGSAACSLYILYHKTSLWNKLKQKYFRHG